MKKILFIFLALFFVKLTANDITWSFPPQTLSTNAFNASDAQVSTDPNGNLTAVWIENNILKSRSKLLNMPWGSLNTVSASGPSSPKVVSAFNGNATALWIENGVVKSATKPLSSGWTTPTALSNSGANFPSLAINSVGDVVAVWTRNGNVESVIKPFGGNWSTRTTITSSSAAMPEVSFGGKGASRIAILVWQANSNSSPVIYASSRTLSTSWSAKQIISDSTHLAANPHVAVDTNGNSTALWYSYDLLNNQIYNVIVQSATLPYQESWSALSTLSEPGIADPSTLMARIAYDGLGNAMALWNTSFDDMSFSIQTAMKPLYGSWMPATDLTTLNKYAYEADFSLSAFGDALAVYMFYNGSALNIQSTAGNISGFFNNLWAVPTTLSTGNQNGFPRAASTVTGNAINAVSVWISANGATNTVVAATGSKSFLSSPTSLSVTQQVQNFGVFQEYYNTFSWHASADPSVIGYLIYRNGIFIDQVSALQYIDNNQPQNGAVTYGVAAINADDTTSKIITVNFP